MVEPEPEALYFTLGGRLLKALPLRALTLSTPFTKLTTDLTAAEPPWDTFPEDIDAAVVPAQPVDVDPPRWTLLPHSIRYVPTCSARYFVDLRGSFSDYLEKFSAKPRHNLTRTVRKFAEFSGGQIQWRAFSSTHEMSGFCQLAVEVSTRSWHERAGGPGFPRSTEFQESITHLAAVGGARGYVLFHCGRPIAHVLCRALDDHLFYSRTGYDLSYAEWSPGRVLLYVLLEGLFSEGKYKWLDFGEGTMPYKEFFSTGHVRCARIIYLRRNLRNLAIVTAHGSLDSFSRGAGRVLGAVRLKERIKGLMMGELQRPGQ